MVKEQDAIYWMKLSDIELWDDNPNMGDVGAICALIQKFGFRQPIGIFQGNITKDGNHRVRALHALLKDKWIPSGPCIRIVNNIIEVAVIDNRDLNEEDGSMLGIGLNRSTRLGHDDAEKLLALLQPMSETDRTIAGYDDGDVQELLTSLEEISAPEEFPEYDDDIETEYRCPKCGYEWSGKPK